MPRHKLAARLIKHKRAGTPVCRPQMGRTELVLHKLGLRKILPMRKWTWIHQMITWIFSVVLMTLCCIAPLKSAQNILSICSLMWRTSEAGADNGSSLQKFKIANISTIGNGSWTECTIWDCFAWQDLNADDVHAIMKCVLSLKLHYPGSKQTDQKVT